jgi:2-C-methyl-D-erythritol 4-phosphate cytidylyltransferase
MRTVAIVPAAGAGRRLGLKTKKPFVLLNGKPLVAHAIAALESSGLIDGIVVAVERAKIGRFRRLAVKYGFRKITGIVAGGRTRTESVRNCLKQIGGSFDMVLIHDGARPFPGKRLIERSIRAAAKFGGCVVAIPESDTVKLADDRMFSRATLDRSRLWRAQTPQAFRRSLIETAYKKAPAGAATDDAALVERLKYNKVRIIEGSHRNIKITTREDLELAAAIARGLSFRVMTGRERARPCA